MRAFAPKRLFQICPIAVWLVGLTPVAAISQPLPNLSELPAAESSSIDRLAPTTVPANYAASSYLLGPGDQIEVSVYSYEEYTGPMSILPDGTITLPLVGKVAAAGQTTEQLARELTFVLDDILIDPQVSVMLTSLRPVVVNVSGEVYRPGPVQLRRQINATPVGNFSTGNAAAEAPPSVSRALVQAGGITRTADIRSVVVMRALPNGETVRTEVNLWDALWSETLPEDLLLRDGDLVFVPELAAGDTINSRLLASSSLSPETVRVRVVGEVTRPGEVPVPPNSSLSSAVAIAGGPTDDAKLSDVAFIRMNDAGEVEQEVVDLRNLVDNYQVQDGDVIMVPETTTSSVLDFASRLISPLNFLFRVFD